VGVPADTCVAQHSNYLAAASLDRMAASYVYVRVSGQVQRC
jgi:hypothetical protein